MDASYLTLGIGLLSLLTFLSGNAHPALLVITLLKPLYHHQDIWREPGKIFICVSQSIALTGSWHLAFLEIPNSLDAMTVFPEPYKTLAVHASVQKCLQRDLKFQARLPFWPESSPTGFPARGKQAWWPGSHCPPSPAVSI